MTPLLVVGEELQKVRPAREGQQKEEGVVDWPVAVLGRE